MVALVVLGYNGFKVMSFLNPSLLGPSNLVKVARQKWQQFDKALPHAAHEVYDSIDLDLMLAHLTPESFKSKQKDQITPPKKEKEAQVRLPKLTGVLSVSDIRGNIRSLAVIGGKRLAEQDRVDEFTVQKITKRGVVLTKNGRRWFLPAPEVRYTLEQGK